MGIVRPLISKLAQSRWFRQTLALCASAAMKQHSEMQAESVFGYGVDSETKFTRQRQSKREWLGWHEIGCWDQAASAQQRIATQEESLVRAERQEGSSLCKLPGSWAAAVPDRGNQAGWRPQTRVRHHPFHVPGLSRLPQLPSSEALDLGLQTLSESTYLSGLIDPFKLSKRVPLM